MECSGAPGAWRSRRASAGLRRVSCIVQCAEPLWSVGVQHQPYGSLCDWVCLVNQPPHLMSEGTAVRCSGPRHGLQPAFGSRNVNRFRVPSSDCTRSHIVQDPAWPRALWLPVSYRATSCLDVSSKQTTGWSGSFVVQVQHVLHPSHELPAHLCPDKGYAPLLLLPRP